MIEHWRPVIGWDGLYEVSDFGRVRSVTRQARDGKTYQGRLRALTPSKNGYLMVDLYRDGERSTRTVHSLVAEAFIGPCPNGQEVCHGVRGRRDNRPDNLRYDTRAGNFADKKRDGTEQLGERHWNAKLTDAQVMVIKSSNKTNAALSRQYKVHSSTISMIRHGKRRVTQGA